MNQPVDFADAVLGEETIKVTYGRPMSLDIRVTYDRTYGLVRVYMHDAETGNGAERATSNGLIRASESGRIPIKSVYELLPSMTEEIVVLNRLMGHVAVQKEEEE